MFSSIIKPQKIKWDKIFRNKILHLFIRKKASIPHSILSQSVRISLHRCVRYNFYFSKISTNIKTYKGNDHGWQLGCGNIGQQMFSKFLKTQTIHIRQSMKEQHVTHTHIHTQRHTDAEMGKITKRSTFEVYHCMLNTTEQSLRLISCTIHRHLLGKFHW